MNSCTTYFRDMIVRDRLRPQLLPRSEPCSDCAVVCGLYTEFSDALKLEPPDIQKAISDKWFCHNNSTRACRGNINNLEGV